MDISAAVMVLGAATTLCGRFIPEFLGYGLTLYGIDNKEIWHKGSFPKSIRNIEETSGWRLVVRGYYLDRASIEWQGWAFVVSLILLWATWLSFPRKTVFQEMGYKAPTDWKEQGS